ncbi:hypothetical protein [Caldimonas tepidiphila]|uniref:hypothetical protein n=1 Tax=Caldimonas tepidiphila TaxID=2315841 RepID=UPI0013002698|nr:hypothetical protein [Caldimonas tepidiphila]
MLLQTASSLLWPALAERLTLAFNHVLAAEPAATDRLRPHAGRVIGVVVSGGPSWAPRPGPLALRVTPAGLLEWQPVAEGVDTGFDLRIGVDASRPGQWAEALLGGARPAVTIQGDAGLAADAAWLIDNVRWDVEEDLARLVGDAPARQAAELLRRIAGGARDALHALRARMPQRPADPDLRHPA